MRVCQNPHCGELAIGGVVRDMCRNCYLFWHRNNRMRRREDRRGKGKPPRTCTNCERAFANRYRSLCRPCAWYERVHGRPRPRYRSVECCQTCERPRDTARWPFAYGRCNACYRYWRRTGRERPQKLIKRETPRGWCLCGRPAVTEEEIQIGNPNGRSLRRETLRLCEECLEWERQSA